MISSENKLEISIYTEGEYIFVVNKLQIRLNKELSTGIGHNSIKERYKIFTDKVPVFEEKNGFYWAIIPLIIPKNNL